MQKEFTVNVPDELWVNKWDAALTQTYTYEGPRYFYIGLNDNRPTEYRHGDLEAEAEEFTEEEAAAFTHVVTIDADVNPELAHMIYVHDHDAHVFEEVLNHDGSIYNKITNPCMLDYFTLDFRAKESDPDAREAFLEPRYKETSNILKRTAEERLARVKKYDDAYDFDDADQTKIDTFVASIEAYIETVSTAYPWKYITMNVSEVPKIPASLQLLFNQLPEID